MNHDTDHPQSLADILDKAFGERPSDYVMCEGMRLPVSELEITDISEDFTGADVVVFRWRGCLYTSNVFKG